MNILCTFKTSDWITILGLLVNSGLAIWIVRTIQNNLKNRRVLKDHFITELKDIRKEYKICLTNLYANSTYPKNIIPWFKLMNIKVTDLMECITLKYKIDKATLSPYQNELRDLVTDNEDFIRQYESNSPVIFSEGSKNTFILFQQKYNGLFNQLIIKINDV